ncbi:MAG: DNA repair protein RadC [Nanohaloarchaea archaeon]|nr:DNA repair protein RadC [Candidatus Nanohaloarchaea archaeon]
MDYRIKDLPESEQPRQKLQDHGVDSLTEAELLSLIIRTGTEGKNVEELSSEILSSYHISSLADRKLEELKQFRGISDVKASQVLAVGELSRRMKNEPRQKIDCLSDLEALVQDMKYLETEELRLFLLSSGNEVLGKHTFEGRVDSVNFSYREIFREAVRSNAAAVIMAHNHPSGYSRPTEKDVKTTKQMIELGEKLDVTLLDHVIVGEDVSSMRRSNRLEFGD